jgi:Fe-S-cluster containining protein
MSAENTETLAGSGISAAVGHSRPNGNSTAPSEDDGPPMAEATPRLEAFGYICRRCSKCCHHKQIQVNPYEIARLAGRRGQTTREFCAAWTADGAGTTLRQTESGACVFLGPEGCTVHSDRPLVCRLYPLGRHVRPDGSERFSRLEGHPQSAGEVTDRGTIGQYLKAQDAESFIVAADEYFLWLCAALERMGEDAGTRRSAQPAQDAALAADLTDMDTAIARHCAGTKTAEPDTIEHRKQLHLRILYRHIANDRGEIP